jgi:hypothetical protein
MAGKLPAVTHPAVPGIHSTGGSKDCKRFFQNRKSVVLGENELRQAQLQTHICGEARDQRAMPVGLCTRRALVRTGAASHPERSGRDVALAKCNDTFHQRLIQIDHDGVAESRTPRKSH